MEITIDIDNYLSEEDKKEICREEYRNSLRKRLDSASEIDRILTNSCYYFVIEELNKIAPNYKDIMVNKVKELILDKDLRYETFYHDSYKGNSAAVTIIDITVKENKDLLKQRVLESIKNYNLKPMIDKAMYDALSELSNNYSNIADFFFDQLHSKINE